MRRGSRTVAKLGVAGAVTATMLAASPALALTGGIDTSSHSYGFDHSLADSAGGVAAMAHGKVRWVAGRNDPPDAADGAVHLDGRTFLSIPGPAMSYGTGDFTIELWLSTRTTRGGTVLDTAEGCDVRAGGFALVLDRSGRLRLRVGGSSGVDGGSGSAGSGRANGGGRPAASFLAEDSDDRGGHPEHGPRVDDGRWHDVTVLRTGSTMWVLVDQTAEDTVTLPPSTDFTGQADVRLGRGRCGDGDVFAGDLDDLTATPAPPAALPETPVAAALPISAALLGGAVIVARRRRHRRHPAHSRRG